MGRGIGRKIISLLRGKRGIALPTTLVVMAALLGLGSASLLLSRGNLMISNNVVNSTKAVWTARAGTEIGKNWLETNLSAGPYPTTLGPTALADGTYTVTIDRYTPGTSDGKFRLTSTGTGPDNSRKVVEEVVRVPGLSVVGAISIDGDGSNAKFDPNYNTSTAIPLSKEVPSFSIDGRNHDMSGNLSALCSGVSPIAGTTGNVNTDATNEINNLKKDIVKEANQECNASGGGSKCTPGFYWVRGSDATERYTDKNSDCPGAQCYQNLDLSAPQLWATAVEDNTVNPPAVTTPASPNNRGPFMYDTPADSTDPDLVKVLTAAEVTQLQQAINDILDFSIDAPSSKRICIASDITTSGTYGTWTDPRIVIVPDPKSKDALMAALSKAACPGITEKDLDVKSGAVVDGAGILIIPKKLRIKDATFNWQGIILVLKDGDFRVDDEDACGAIIGAVLLQDAKGGDPKLTLGEVEQQGTTGVCGTRPPLGCNPYSNQCSPFAVDYSCEAINNALSKLLTETVSWTEQFGT